MSGISICTVVPDALERIKDFRFRKGDSTAVLILKVDREKHEIHIDEQIDDLDSVDDLKDHLPEHQPRFIILSYKQKHEDGRVSFPICFIFYTPRDSHAELQMMYAGSKISLQRESELSRSYEVRELEDLTEEWLLEKLGNK